MKNQIWIVSFNPKTNQFHYDTISNEIRSNLENIVTGSDLWVTVGVCNSILECDEIAKGLEPIIKKGLTPVEKFIIDQIEDDGISDNGILN